MGRRGDESLTQLHEFVTYLKEESGFDRLLPKLIERYRQLGRIGGSVKLTHLQPNEKMAFTTFFRKDYTHQSSATISFALFEKALSKTKYAHLEIKDILEAYAGEKLVTKMEEKEQYELQKEAFFHQLIDENPHAARWLHFVKNKGRGTRFLHSLYDENCQLLRTVIQHVCQALKQLPRGNRFERLPFFAQKITKNPHAFDLDGEQGKALLHALQFHLYEKGEISFIYSQLTSEEANDILQSFHLLRDDLLNFVTCIGLLGTTSKGDYELFQAANREQAALNLPLREVVKLTTCRPIMGNAVFIVENSGVCATILDRWPFPEPPPLICTHGQFKLAALLLIDLLVKENVTIYYSGDFDGEGLQMAQRLKKRAPEHVKLWRYSLKDYQHCISNKDLENERLSRLNMIDLPELMEVREEMINQKKAGYQEELIDELIHDMKIIC